MITEFLKQLRKSRNLNQTSLARHLGISRATYVQVESGKRELTLSEAKKLADFFGLSLEDFLNERDPRWKVSVKKSSARKPKARREFRISVPEKNLVKFKEVLLYVLSKVGAMPNVGETVLYKLLYFIDFDFYEKYEEQLMGATYFKNKFGPTPLEFKKVVDEMEKNGDIVRVRDKYFAYLQKKYLPRRSPDLTKLKDARELKHIDEVLARLADKNAAELTQLSHEDVPWLVAKDNQPIDYEAVFYRTAKTSVRNYE